MPRLIVIKGADEGKQFELADKVVGVGRDANNRLRLSDTEVSRRHAEFRQTPDGYRLVDVGSANGTFVNNQPATVAILRQLAPALASVHAQNETILAFDAAARLVLLDTFACVDL